MLNFFKSMAANFGVVGEMAVFLWRRKLYWLMPMVLLLFLLGLLLVFASSSGIGAFIYTLF